MAFADDYVGVHERINQFLEKFPDGRIQTEIAKHTDTVVIMKATVYRGADDDRPSVAHSQLDIPGKTNFTRGSEVENAETSAVGRALAFMGFETKKGIASREEVQSRQVAREEPEVRHVQTAPEWAPRFIAQMQERELTWEDLSRLCGGEVFTDVNRWQLIGEWMRAMGKPATAMLNAAHEAKQLAGVN